MIKQKAINDIKVVPVISQGGEPDVNKIKGNELIPLLYSNTFICAKKKSGKTNVIYTMLDKLAGSRTAVYIFASTVTKDKTYKKILAMLKKKDITYDAHTSFIDGKTGANLLDKLTKSAVADVALSHQGKGRKRRKKKKHGKAHSGSDSDSDSDSSARSGPGSGSGSGSDSDSDSDYNPLRDVPRLSDSDSDSGYDSRGRERKAIRRYLHLARHRRERTEHERAYRRRPIKKRGRVPRRDTFQPESFLYPTSISVKLGPVFHDQMLKGKDKDRAKDDDGGRKERKKEAPIDSGTPDVIFVFDDLGSDLRHPSINQLLKTNRHEKAKVILSSQYITDLQPQAIKQLDFCLLFKSFSEEKLRKMHELLDLGINFDHFTQMYKFATEIPYSFLYIDVRNEKFRKNFNTALSISKETNK